MADEMVTLRIRVVGKPNEISRFSKEVKQLSAQSKLASTQINAVNKSTSGLNQRLKDWNKNHKALSGTLQKFIGILDKIGKLTVKLGTIGFAVILASLSALTGAFALGNLAVKAYRVSMAALAGVAATAVAAIAAFAAAQRELNAATMAYTNKSAPALGSAFNQSRAALRNLQSDAQLATAGMEALNATFAAVSKNASFDAKATKALRALDDFASAGGDRGKNLAAAGEFYGLLQKGIASGKLGLTAEIEEAGKAISPAFEKGLKEFKKKGGKKNLKTLQDAIMSGQLAEMGGVTGQAQAVNDTLISILKGYFTRLQTLFADIGQPLLEPLKKAADRIFRIIRDTILRIAPDVQAFGKGTLLDGLVTAFEKVTDFLVKLMREYLPKTEGMLKGFGSWWRKFITGWNIVVDRLQGAVEAGREVNRIFGPVLLNVFKRLGDMFNNTSNLIKNNEDKFQSLANTVNNILQLISNLYTFFTEALVEAAPALEGISSAFLVIADAIGKALEAVQAFFNFLIPGGAGSSLGGLAQILTLLLGGGLAKQFLKGGFAGGVGNAVKQTGVGRAVTGGANAVKGAGAAAKNAGGAVGRGMGRIIPGGSMFFPTGTGGRGGGRIIPSGKALSTGYSRGRAQGQGVLSSAGRGLKGQYKSVTRGQGLLNPSMGRMAAGAGVGLAGNFLVEKGVLDESTRGGIAVGSTALGLGLPPMLAAGLGLGTAAWNAKTAGGGALLGAGAGAAIGSQVGGPVGAVIGAAIGGVAGAIKGMRNKIDNEKKKSRAAVTELMTGYKNELLAGMIQGTAGKTLGTITGKIDTRIGMLSQFKGMSDTAKQFKAQGMLDSGQITKEDYDLITMKQLDSYTGELQKQSKTMKEAAAGPIKTYNNRMKELTQMTGKTEQEIHDLSMEMGVNLYDDTLNLADAMTKLGTAVDLTVEGIIGASRDISIKALGVFDEVINRAEAEKVIDEAAEELRQLGGGATKEDVAKFSRTAYEQLQILNPGASEFELLSKFNTAFGAGGTAYTQAGGPLEGMEATVRASGGMDLNNQFYAQAMTQQKGLLADQLVTALSGSNLSVNRADILTQLNAMDPMKLAAIQNQVATGDFSAFTAGRRNAASEQAEGALARAGITVDVAEMAKTVPEQLSAAAEELRQELVNGITEGFKNTPEWFKQKPDWYNKETFEALFGDTSTPRAGRVGDTKAPKALGRTMARHNYINSMITGSRSITSSYRTYGLGSINSDHVTGNAYDLTGQNLGMYASAVKGMGGVAEFHGIGGARHLHVVPGQTPVGDMTAPRMGTAVMAPSVSSGGGDNITVNVYGAAGQDETIIAQKVVGLLEKRQRSVKERM